MIILFVIPGYHGPVAQFVGIRVATRPLPQLLYTAISRINLDK